MADKLYLDSGKASEGALYRMPQDWLGVPDNQFVRDSSFYFLVAMVARVYEPGCKFDCVPIIVSAQGAAKGVFIAELAFGLWAGLRMDFRNPGRMIEDMRGALVCELGEMTGFNRETTELAKDFITRATDKFRLAYGRRESLFPRQSVMIGDSNLDEVLYDPTGNRRFWIWVSDRSEANPIDIEGFKKARPMLWGEAVDCYRRMREEQPHGSLWLDLRSKESRRLRDEIALQFTQKTAVQQIAEIIEEHLDQERPESAVSGGLDAVLDPGEDERMMVRNLVSTMQLYEELDAAGLLKPYRNADARTVGKAMKMVKGWENLGQRRVGGDRQRWHRREGSTSEDLWVPAEKAAPKTEPDIDDLLS